MTSLSTIRTDRIFDRILSNSVVVAVNSVYEHLFRVSNLFTNPARINSFRPFNFGLIRWHNYFKRFLTSTTPEAKSNIPITNNIMLPRCIQINIKHAAQSEESLITSNNKSLAFIFRSKEK